MPPPQTEKEIRGFLGRVQYISRFISHSTCEPIHKLLKKNYAGKWDEACQKAFDKIKEYLPESTNSSASNARKAFITIPISH